MGSTFESKEGWKQHYSITKPSKGRESINCIHRVTLHSTDQKVMTVQVHKQSPTTRLLNHMCTTVHLANANPSPHTIPHSPCPMPHDPFPLSMPTSSTSLSQHLVLRQISFAVPEDVEKTLTPQLLHPQLEQLPLQVEQLAQ